VKETPLRKALIALVVVLSGLAVAGVAWAASDTSESHPAQKGLADTRRAVNKYRDVGVAQAAGFADLHLCVPQMGQHYTLGGDPHTFTDGILDPEKPEALVYADDGKGGLKLVAVEWVSTTPGSVVGQDLHLNTALNVWVLHAWIGQGNPDGVFADMNPNIGGCEDRPVKAEK
jgi:hypothetical protein